MKPKGNYAVMAHKHEIDDEIQDYPTPPWATRALINHVIKPLMPRRDLSRDTVWEPSCNRGYMVRALSECFYHVTATDVAQYGDHAIQDFLDGFSGVGYFDWIITNPPFNKAEDFIRRCEELEPRAGYAMLVRTAFLEGVGRYDRLFARNPPNVFAQFSERVPMVKGRYDPKASTATSYCWLVWLTHWKPGETVLMWIPPCRRQLEKDNDV